MQELIDNSNGMEIDKSISVSFSTGDLYYSLHKADIYLKGTKYDDGWYFECALHDTYDFTEIQTLMNDNEEFDFNVSLGTVANDLAVVSEYTGAISSYEIYVFFRIKRE